MSRFFIETAKGSGRLHAGGRGLELAHRGASGLCFSGPWIQAPDMGTDTSVSMYQGQVVGLPQSGDYLWIPGDLTDSFAVRTSAEGTGRSLSLVTGTYRGARAVVFDAAGAGGECVALASESQAWLTIYDETTNTWRASSDNPSGVGPGARPVLAALNGRRVLVAGGVGAYILDVDADTWTDVSAGWTVRVESSWTVADISSRVVVIGGRTPGTHNVVTAVQVWDDDTSTWLNCGTTSRTTYLGEALFYDSRFNADIELFIIVFGGMATGTGVDPAVSWVTEYIVNVTTPGTTSTALTDMPAPRVLSTMLDTKGNSVPTDVILLGGCPSLTATSDGGEVRGPETNTVWRWLRNPGLGSWTEDAEPMLYHRSNAPAALLSPLSPFAGAYCRIMVVGNYGSVDSAWWIPEVLGGGPY